jgi:hypothetical protein
LVLAGCSRGRPVEGKVTYAGKPVDGGMISFIPTAGAPVSAEIVGGKYSLPASRGPRTGPHRVEIVWKVKTGKQVDVPGDAGNLMDETEQVIPSEYNTGSTQTAEVKSSGNTFDFNIPAGKGGGTKGKAQAVGD